MTLFLYDLGNFTEEGYYPTRNAATVDNKRHLTRHKIMAYIIALVEDDDLLQVNYSKALTREGYQVQCYASRPEASAAFRRQLPDLAILDVMLQNEPEGGFELCRELRRLSSIVPIIFLTAKDSDLDRVSGLRLGAWDYLTKNTTTLEFLPVRIAALFAMVDSLRSGFNSSPASRIHMVGELTVDPERKQISWQKTRLDLTLTEFWLLQALTDHPGHVKSYEQLMTAANVIVTNNAITAHIRRIREKFRVIDPAFDRIRSEYGMGYRWVCN
jgi:two-component system OmpR family response regulator